MSSKTNEIAIKTNTADAIPAADVGADNIAPRIPGAVISAAGIVIAVLALLHPAFRGTGGELSGQFVLPLACGTAMIAVGLSLGTQWAGAAFWFGIGLAGQSAALQLIDAGKLIHFQHYRGMGEIAAAEWTGLLVFAAQAIAVAAGVVFYRADVRPKVFGRFRKWQLVLVALFISLSSAAVTPDATAYLTSILLGSIVQAVSIATIVMFACAVPADGVAKLSELLGRALGTVEQFGAERKGMTDPFAALLAIAVVAVTGCLSYFVYEAYPHVPDEAQYIFQANYLAAGQLAVKAPLVPEAFSMYMVPSGEPQWYGIFPPGWPLLLAIGVLGGASWLVNPIIAGICVLLADAFFRQLFDKPSARVGLMLLACSPWFIFMGMSYMSHMATLALALAAAVLVFRGIRTRKAIYFVVAGLSIGGLSLVRQLDAAVVAVVIGVWLLIALDGWRARILNNLALVMGTLAVAVWALPYNRAVTGSLVVSPSDAYYSKYFWPNVMALGFGPDRGVHWGLDAFPGHSPLEALINDSINIFQVNTELFGWATGSLILIAIFLASGAAGKKDIWAVASILAITGAYSLFWFHGGPDFGARYWFLCIIPMVALTVRSIEWLSGGLRRADGTVSESGGRVLLAVGALLLTSLLAYTPWRAADKYFGYLGTRPGMQRLAKQIDFGRSVVVVRGQEHRDYQGAWILNPVNFEGDGPLYAYGAGPRTCANLAAKYADRPFWIVDGPTLTGGEYKIVAGPLTAAEASSF